ncbi:MAG: metallophosphoesterase family protein [Candidatus Zixiibacteriota bacterium]|jgi:UDP-2,3-diacylglucosamine pyrophosphatase LpxH
MSQDPAVTYEKLTSLWDDEDTPVFETSGRKYVVISDVHLGDGGQADDFVGNTDVMIRALQHYRDQGYTLVLLGDIEEFWQFDLNRIVEQYRDTVYKAIRDFGDDRVYRVFGNHDIEWGTLEDPGRNTPAHNVAALQAIKLKSKSGKTCGLLVHGHQGSTESDKTSWFSRFFVRLFANFEGIAKALGLYGHKAATKSMITEDYERIMYGWAKQQRVILICGHSHRAIFASRSYLEIEEEKMLQIGARLREGGLDQQTVHDLLEEMDRRRKHIADERARNREIRRVEPSGPAKPCYFNDGCALYPDGMTVIEIDDDELRLVKWNLMPRNGNYREIYCTPMTLSECEQQFVA